VHFTPWPLNDQSVTALTHTALTAAAAADDDDEELMSDAHVCDTTHHAVALQLRLES